MICSGWGQIGPTPDRKKWNSFDGRGHENFMENIIMTNKEAQQCLAWYYHSPLFRILSLGKQWLV